MEIRRPISWFVTTVLLVAPVMAARAQEQVVAGNRVSFQVERTRRVPNDRARAVVGVTLEDEDPASLARRVNQAMAWGLDRIGGNAGVTGTSGGYHTSPIYQDGHLRRWRATQELVLEGTDAETVADLLGRLQERLQIHNFTLSVSDGARRKAQDDLILDALAAFRARAGIIQEGLGATGWHLEEARVDTPTRGPGPGPRRLALEATGAPPVAVETGTSQVTVTVRGTVVLESGGRRE